MYNIKIDVKQGGYSSTFILWDCESTQLLRVSTTQLGNYVRGVFVYMTYVHNLLDICYETMSNKIEYEQFLD